MSHDQKPTKMRVVGSASQSAGTARTPTLTPSSAAANIGSHPAAPPTVASARYGFLAAFLFLFGCVMGAVTLSLALYS